MYAQADLPTILDHYDIDYSPGREKQMISCPWHEDRHPSMSLDLTDGLWKCFSCGEGGDGYTIIKLMEKVGFRDAVNIAARIGAQSEGTREGDQRVSESTLTGRRVLVKGKRDRRGQHRWKPSWRSG